MQIRLPVSELVGAVVPASPTYFLLFLFSKSSDYGTPER